MEVFHFSFLSLSSHPFLPLPHSAFICLLSFLTAYINAVNLGRNKIFMPHWLQKPAVWSLHQLHCLCRADLVFRMSSQCNFRWNSFGTYGKEEVWRVILMCTSLLHVLTDRWQSSDCHCLMYWNHQKACWIKFSHQSSIKWSEECRETKSRSIYSQLAFLYSFPY